MAGEVTTTIHREAGSSELSLREEWWKVGRTLPPNRSLVLRENGVAKAVVRVFWRDALLAGKLNAGPIVTMKAAGIGWVFTHPDARGRGLASLLMKAAHVWLAEDHGCPAAFLYSRVAPGLYDTLGYKTIREVTHAAWKEPKRLMGLALVPGVTVEPGHWTLSPEDPF